MMKKIVPAPYIDQTERWVNGCESISAVMLLQAVGVPIDPDVFIERDLPYAPYWEQDGRLYGPDPMYVYPGDPHDHTGYGCYAPCIVTALQSALEHEGAADRFEVVDESGKTAAQLCSYLDAGMPVVFWATLDFTPVPAERDHWLLAELLVQRPVARPRRLPPAQGAGGGMPCCAGSLRRDPAPETAGGLT